MTDLKTLQVKLMPKKSWMFVIIGITGAFTIAFLTMRILDAPRRYRLQLPVPEQSDWVDYGMIFEKGEVGDWDYQLFGGFTATSIKKDGTYFLYYQGASGYRSAYDETVTWRAIGLATSPDGVNFTKSENNPVITWFPKQGGEEGAVSGSIVRFGDDQLALVYGANTLKSKSEVYADGRLSISEDGHSFNDQGIVLNHQDSKIWGSRDELFPIIAFQEADRWVVYYIPNGSLVSARLGVAWGENLRDLNHSAGVRSGSGLVQAWGAGSAARVGNGIYALFLNNVRERKIEVRSISIGAPQRISDPVQTYHFEDKQVASVYLDYETRTWFMFYRTEDGYGLKLAPAGTPDKTPPSPPEEVFTRPVSESEIKLSWTPGVDRESGIVQYRVYRDGKPIGIIKGWDYLDSQLAESTTYEYCISAINYHGYEGSCSPNTQASTTADTNPPLIESVSASGDANEVMVTFNEPVDPKSVGDPANYQIPGIAVYCVSLTSDAKSVKLNTSEHEPDKVYNLRLENITDQASSPNKVSPDTHIYYSYSAYPGLVGYWKFEEGSGAATMDAANFGNEGKLNSNDQAGPSWTSGVEGGGLYFDGVDDHVTIPDSPSLSSVDGSFTFSAWVKPEGRPENTNPNNSYYTILAQDYTGLYFSHDGNFRGHLQLANGDQVVVSSEARPDTWQHVSFVVDALHKKIHLLIDGVEVSGSPVTYQGEPAYRQGKPLYIGTSEPLKERYEYRFRGWVDEVKIYNQAVLP